MITNIIILVTLLILSAFFSASEVAFVSLTDSRVATMIKRKLPRAKLVKKLKSNPRRLLVTILIGNNIVNIAAASLATVVAADLFQSAVIGITTGVMTLLVLIFGEIVPKSYATNHVKKIVILSTPILYVFQMIGWPIVIIFEGLSNLLTGKHKPDRIYEEELKAMALLGKKQGTIEKDEEMILNRLFEMNDIEAGDIMTQKKKVKFLKDIMTIDEVADVIVGDPHTRFPIVHNNFDKVVGLVYAKDILAAFNDDTEDRSITKIMRPFFVVKMDIKIDRLMQIFQKKKIHMAVVVDEKGKNRGVVTLEDVLEELVGEIIDETDLE